MSITVTRVSDDGLSMREWRFSPTIEGTTVNIRLTFYGRSVRPTKRHKFRFEPADRWNWMDERSYTSGLSRTHAQNSVTDDVVAEAAAQVMVHYERRADDTWRTK